MTAAARITAAAKILRHRSHHKLANTAEDRKARKAFGRAVCKRRCELDLSQVEVASLVGSHSAQVSNIELGRNWPSIPVYRKLCDVLRVGPLPLME